MQELWNNHQKISRTGEALGEIIIDRRQKTITRATIFLAYQKAVELMKKLKWTAQQAMDALDIPEADQKRFSTML